MYVLYIYIYTHIKKYSENSLNTFKILISDSIISMSSLPNDFLFNAEMDDSVASLSSSDSASSASPTSLPDNFLTINDVDKI